MLVKYWLRVQFCMGMTVRCGVESGVGGGGLDALVVGADLNGLGVEELGIELDFGGVGVEVAGELAEGHAVAGGHGMKLM